MAGQVPRSCVQIHTGAPCSSSCTSSWLIRVAACRSEPQKPSWLFSNPTATAVVAVAGGGPQYQNESCPLKAAGRPPAGPNPATPPRLAVVTGQHDGRRALRGRQRAVCLRDLPHEGRPADGLARVVVQLDDRDRKSKR